MVWEFVYQPEANSEHSAPVLHIVSKKQPNFCENTTVTVTGPARMASLRVDPTHFLILQPGYEKFAAPGGGTDAQLSGIEVLVEKRHNGWIFAHGIFIAADRQLQGIGLHFTGPKQYLKMLGLGRDRNLVKIHCLVAMIPALVASLKQHSLGQYSQLVHLLYRLLEEALESAIRFLGWWKTTNLLDPQEKLMYSAANFHIMACGFMGVFNLSHSEAAVPSTEELVRTTRMQHNCT